MGNQIPRRNFLTKALLAIGATVALPALSFTKSFGKKKSAINTNPIKNVKALGFTWETADPFLFCVHHEDNFPKGTEEMGVDPKYFQGRHMGEDFIIKDGFRMYHGKSVPGFPGHPHRGFETITVVRKGIVDHSDSMGASGRYGDGDVQWMTAGKGVQHCEMFPLLHTDKENPMELFQIWLNLPKKNKMVEAHYKMFWRESIGKLEHVDAAQKKTIVEVIAGDLMNIKAPVPPPDSWASDLNNQVAIWNILMDPAGTFTIPKTSAGINRFIYFYEGDEIEVAGNKIGRYHSVELQPDVDVKITAGKETANILLLQGRPIGEP